MNFTTQNYSNPDNSVNTTSPHWVPLDYDKEQRLKMIKTWFRNG